MEVVVVAAIKRREQMVVQVAVVDITLVQML
jgi:hypothetical protein